MPILEQTVIHSIKPETEASLIIIIIIAAIHSTLPSKSRKIEDEEEVGTLMCQEWTKAPVCVVLTHQHFSFCFFSETLSN